MNTTDFVSGDYDQIYPVGAWGETETADGWIPHDGGPCPIPDAKAGEYFVWLDDGRKFVSSYDARDRQWRNVIRYRLIKPTPSAELLLRQAGEALRGITEACIEDCGRGDEWDADDDCVGGGLNEDGTLDPMALTFGHIRRARAVLAAIDARVK